MPICTTCTHPVPQLYTLYPSKYNLRLELCPECTQFADPYVEHDPLVVLLDLVLLKRGAYRHLLFNRGAKPRKLSADGKEVELPADEYREVNDLDTLWKLGLSLVAIDAFIRWSSFNPSVPPPPESPKDGARYDPAMYTWTWEGAESLGRTFLGCLIETLAFHVGVVLASWLALRLFYHDARRAGPSHLARVNPARISLSLFYSSLTKLFLLLLLSVWRVSSSHEPSDPVPPSFEPFGGLAWLPINQVLFWLDSETLDREWIIRNLLGGFSAGFGLRVVLECHPLLTTLIVLVGWAAKSGASQWIATWAEGNGEVWGRAYSIP